MIGVNMTYANRIPPGYRWAMTGLVTAPLVVVVVAVIAGYVGLVEAVLLGAVVAVFVAVYLASGTVISATPDSVLLQLFPLWRKRVLRAEIRAIRVEEVEPLRREWGSRGSLRRDRAILVDAGHSTTCLAFHLVDGTVIRMGVASPERGKQIVRMLET